mmetsp:Transcript_31802/g.123429  ORF Transcript_31802/g.123429 Transcript_31802/m.123429 type:complete len:224 (-) Transcript_31802:3801-4472(-)
MVDHYSYGEIMLIVLLVQIALFGPKHCLFTGLKQPRDASSLPPHFTEVHHLGLSILREQNAKLSEHLRVCSLKPETGLDQFNSLEEVARPLVILNYTWKLPSLHNNFLSASLRKAKLSCIYTCKKDSSPHFYAIRLFCVLECLLQVSHVYIHCGELGVVLGQLAHKTSRKPVFIVKASLSDIVKICCMRSLNKLLELRKAFCATQGIDYFRVHRPHVLHLIPR